MRPCTRNKTTACLKEHRGNHSVVNNFKSRNHAFGQMMRPDRQSQHGADSDQNETENADVLIAPVRPREAPCAADGIAPRDARLMGFASDRVVHIREGSKFLGNAAPELLDQVGETVGAPARPFAVVPEFQHLHAL